MGGSRQPVKTVPTGQQGQGRNHSAPRRAAGIRAPVFCPPHPQIANRQERRPQNPGKAGIQTRAACCTRGSPAWVAPEKHQLSLGAPAGGLEVQPGPGISPTCPPPPSGAGSAPVHGLSIGGTAGGAAGDQRAAPHPPLAGVWDHSPGRVSSLERRPGGGAAGLGGPRNAPTLAWPQQPGPARSGLSFPICKGGMHSRPGQAAGCTFPARPLSPGSLRPQFPRPVPPRPGLTMAPRDIGRLALSPPPPRVLGRNGVAAARANQREAAGAADQSPWRRAGPRKKAG